MIISVSLCAINWMGALKCKHADNIHLGTCNQLSLVLLASCCTANSQCGNCKWVLEDTGSDPAGLVFVSFLLFE